MEVCGKACVALTSCCFVLCRFGCVWGDGGFFAGFVWEECLDFFYSYFGLGVGYLCAMWDELFVVSEPGADSWDGFFEMGLDAYAEKW